MAGGNVLGRVRTAAEKVERRELELTDARHQLREAILVAYDEGIPIARIAREAKLSRQWVSHVVHGRDK